MNHLGGPEKSQDLNLSSGAPRQLVALKAIKKKPSLEEENVMPALYAHSTETMPRK